jgi:hypothetical protein
MIRIDDAKPIVFGLVVPFYEANDDIDALSVANARDPEKRLDVEHAESARFDVVTQQIRGCPKDETRRPPVALHDVIGDESMPSQDQLESAFALADAALSEQEQAYAEDVHEHSMKRRLWGQAIVEDGVKRIDRAARAGVRDEERGARCFRGCNEGARRLAIAGGDNAR